MTSMRRRYVASTSLRRHVPAGNFPPLSCVPPPYSKPSYAYVRLIISGKEDLASGFSVYTEQLSRRLYKVLESIGASTEMRDSRCQAATSNEILLTMSVQYSNIYGYCSSNASVHRSFYICGSTFEGTTIEEMMSDVDLLIVKECQPVVTDISDASHHDRLLMVQDLYTPPGYVKLQCVLNGVPLFLSSVRSCISGAAYDKDFRAVLIDYHDIKDGQVINGPAISAPETETSYAHDFVHAVRCRKIPDCASEWFTRHRHYNWPTPQWIDKCKTLGCFFVFVGHPDSEERHLQWRMSFSLQERLLVTQFNSVQLKCYILTKIIKKDIIQKDVGEKSLTSYQCKTCLLYLIENTPAEFWREDNLLVCLYTYLSKILRCVETMDCPNYFIPDENMFNGRLHGETQIKLQMVLRNILSADFQCLFKLKTESLGRRFQHAIVCSALHCRLIPDFTRRKNLFLSRHVAFMVSEVNDVMLREIQSSHTDPAVSGKRLHRLKLRLQNTETLTEHTREQTQKALSVVCQYIDIRLMSVMAVLAKSLHKSNAFIFRILTSEKWHQISLKSDPFSSKLKQASLLYMMEFPEVSLAVLLNLERTLQHQFSLCSCSWGRRFHVNFSAENYSTLEGNTAEEILEKNIIPCVTYLPAEKDLTPTAICYEMNRSLGFPDDDREDWYDWAVVDGKILLYFLLYLNHHHCGMEAHASADVENIKWLIETDKYLGHRETALNLLGWIYKERGRVDSAVECFRKSLTIQPTHNAAFWHLRDIENVLLIFLSSRFNVR